MLTRIFVSKFVEGVKGVSDFVATVTVYKADSQPVRRRMTLNEIEREYTDDLMGDHDTIRHIQEERERLSHVLVVNPIVRVSFDIPEGVTATTSIFVKVTRREGEEPLESKTLEEIRDNYLSLLTVNQANKLVYALYKCNTLEKSESGSGPRDRALSHIGLRDKINDLDGEYFGIPIDDKKPMRSSCSFFCPPQMTFKEYLQKLEKEDPGKALQIVTLLKNEKNKPEVDVKVELQKILSKHRGFVRQWLQDMTGCNFGETTGAKLYNKLMFPK